MKCLFGAWSVGTLGIGVLGGLFVGYPSVALGQGATDRVAVRSPLRAVEGRGDEPVVRLVLDEAGYRAVASREHVVLSDFVLSAEKRVDVELRRIDVFADDARIVLGTAQGDVPVGRPDVVVMGGRVVGHPASSVFVSLSPYGSNGFVRLGGESFVISGGPFGGGGDTVAFNLTGLPVGSIKWSEVNCLIDEVVMPAGGMAGPVAAASEYSGQEAPCRIANMAVETDWEFTGVLFGGNTAASAAYAATLIGAISEIYRRDFNVRVQIGYLRVWSDENDPWDSSGAGDQLVQFREYWNANMGHVERHVAHFLSGRSLGGGVAYLPGLCNTEWDYGLSGNLGGYFPYPLLNNHWQNWDPFVVAHELGHNFGTGHTHCYVPMIDHCVSTDNDCSDGIHQCGDGTIMSYCHTCSGGMNNILLEFHQRVIDESVMPYLDGVWCELVPDPPVFTEQPVDRGNCEGAEITFTAAACGDVGIGLQWRKDGVSISGATGDTLTIEPLTAADAGDYDVLVVGGSEPQVSEVGTLTVFSGGCTADVNHDGTISIFDLFCVIDVYGGDFAECSFADSDIQPCGGNGVVNIFDLFGVLNAFAGIDPC